MKMRRVVITEHGYLAGLAASKPGQHQQVMKLLFSGPKHVSLAEERQFDVLIAGQRWR